MDHVKEHIGTEHSMEGHKEKCRYCLKMFATNATLSDHLATIHPMQTRDSRNSSSSKCIICRVRALASILPLHLFSYFTKLN